MAAYRRTLSLVLALGLSLPALASYAWGVNGTARPAPRAAAYMPADSFDSADATWTSAPALPGVSQHFFSSLPGTYLLTADEDWFKVSVSAANTPVIVNVQRLSGQGASCLDVYASQGGVCATASLAFAGPADPNDAPPLLGSQTPAGWWSSGTASMYFVAPAPGTYYFRHRPAVFDESGELATQTAGPGYPRDATPNVENTAMQYEIHVIVGDADRIAGSSRYGTSVAVSRMMWNAADDPWWWEGPWGNGVILVSGESFADGLAATSLSLRSGMPILLTKRNSLPPDVRAEIERLGAGNKWRAWDGDNTFTVYVCGSGATISDDVVTQLDGLANVTKVERLAGSNRYATAAAIAEEASAAALYKHLAPTGLGALRRAADKAFVINGNSWPDGLSAGPVAAFADAPVLMVASTALPPSTRDWLVNNGIRSVYVVGGPASVSDAVMGEIASLPTSPTVERIAGANRWETSYRLARYGVDHFGMSDGGCAVVSGEAPWDALSAGQLSFMTYTPLLLTPKAKLSSWVEQFYRDAGWFSQPSYVLGGNTAVSPAAFGTLQNLWRVRYPR